MLDISDARRQWLRNMQTTTELPSNFAWVFRTQHLCLAPGQTLESMQGVLPCVVDRCLRLAASQDDLEVQASLTLLAKILVSNAQAVQAAIGLDLVSMIILWCRYAP